jgi:hypothetical protein
MKAFKSEAARAGETTIQTSNTAENTEKIFAI